MVYLSGWLPILLIVPAAAAVVFIIFKLHPIRCFRCRRKLKNVADEVILESGFYYDKERDIFVSEPDAWQRRFGYQRLYDEAMPFLAVVADSEPIYFDCGGKSWLIQLWKGQYGITCGFEIGVYQTGKSNADKQKLIYQSVPNAQMPLISFRGYKKCRPYFSRPLSRHWWMTGFRLGDFCKPKHLSMEVTLTFDTIQMTMAFVCALKNMGYTNVTCSGRSVKFCFDRPHSRQPYTRNAVIDFFVLSYDWIMVKLCRGLTSLLCLSQKRRRRCFGWMARCRMK